MTANLVPLVVAVCILAAAYLCGYVHGHIAGSKAGRKLAEREQAREAAKKRVLAEYGQTDLQNMLNTDPRKHGYRTWQDAQNVINDKPNAGVYDADGRRIARGVGGVRVNPSGDGRIRIEYP